MQTLLLKNLSHASLSKKVKTRNIFCFVPNMTSDLIFHCSLLFCQLKHQRPTKFVPTFSLYTSLILKEEFHSTKKTSDWGDENSSKNRICTRIKYHFEYNSPLYPLTSHGATKRTVCVVWLFIFFNCKKIIKKISKKNTI